MPQSFRSSSLNFFSIKSSKTREIIKSAAKGIMPKERENSDNKERAILKIV